MRILVELKYFELAVNIAQAFELDVGYPLSYLIANISKIGDPVDHKNIRNLQVNVNVKEIQKLKLD